MISAVDLRDKIEEVHKPWSAIEVARANDQVIRIALFQGEYHWHKHTNEDELFYVIKGLIVIQLESQAPLTLHEGQMAVIPKGVVHCPRSQKPSYVMMFEPYVLRSCGD